MATKQLIKQVVEQIGLNTADSLGQLAKERQWS